MSCELPPHHRALWLTSREIMALIIHNSNFFINSIKTAPNINSSYSYCYERFKEIFNRVKPPINIQSCIKINIETSLQGFQNQAKKNVDPILMQSSYSNLMCNYKEKGFKLIATDASVVPELNKSGLAIVDEYSNIIHRFFTNEKMSSKSAELLAIDKAVGICIEEGYQKVALFTDSKTSCQVLLKKPDDDFIVASIINNIEQAANLTDFHIIWTPSHVGIELNETADQEARLALDEGLEIFPELTPTEALNQIRSRIFTSWEEEFIEQSTTKGKSYFELFPKITSECWFKNKFKKLSPAEIKLMNRLLANHTFSKPFLHKMGLTETPNCDFCDLLEHNNHFFFECPKYDRFRNNFTIFSKFNNLNEVLKSMSEKYFIELFKFAKITNFEKQRT